MDDIQSLLYYPLGLMPSIFFSLRFFIQWTQSEISKKSHVTVLFWNLSLAGNILAAMHYVIQLQYIYIFIQVGNAFISSRNITLANKPDGKRLSITARLLVVSLFIGLFLLACFCQLKFMNSVFNKNDISIYWNLLGGLGGALFAGRFWIQWWNVEKQSMEQFNKRFWLLSILGGLISIVYSAKINDVVSVINFSAGMVPYVRNLILLVNTEVASSNDKLNEL